MAVDSTGRFVTGRTHPGLLFVSVTAVPGQADKKEGLLELRSTRTDKTVILDTAELRKHTRRKIT